MNKMKFIVGALSLCLITTVFQNMKVTATRDRAIEEMVYESFVLIDDNGNAKTVQLDTVSSDEKEVSVEDKYEVVDNVGGEVVETFATEKEAMEAMVILEEELEEELEVQPFNLRNIQYGVVYINTYKSYSEGTNAQTGQSVYISGAFGRDGAYIGTFGDKIRTKIAGVIVDFNASDVDVVSYEGNPTSYYMEKDGYLTHYFLYGSEKIYSTVRVGYNLDYLESNKAYYSYDGHYFYDSYEKMIQDYKNNVYTQAINATQPYYNYYQYLSHRSTASLKAEDYDQYTKATLETEAAYQSSKFYQLGQYIVDAQNKYTVNGLMIYGVAANESNMGRSSIAKDKNNLFGHSAFDDNPYDGSDVYESVQQSVNVHAYNFISRGYLDYDDWRHNGPHLGDKEGGINVRYASDPYWGEKAASRIYYMDTKDPEYGSAKMGIITGAFSSVPLYKEATTTSKALTVLTNLSNFPVIVLNEVTEQNGTVWYKIASDTSLVEDRSKIDYSLVYRPDHDYLYIQKDKVQIVWEGKVKAETGHNCVLEGNNYITQSKVTVADMKLNNPEAVIYKGEEVITDENALVGTGYTIKVQDKTYTIIKLGDVNGDGVINSGDLFSTQKYLIGKSTLTSEASKAADVNGDGKINSGDLFNIQKHLIKKIQFLS